MTKNDYNVRTLYLVYKTFQLKIKQRNDYIIFTGTVNFQMEIIDQSLGLYGNLLHFACDQQTVKT